ncbi:MAG: type II CAAX endopeptidase family protein [Acidimicrobiia bacterium]|nr:MAG: type II CAAX endopeptidase family protein [Acidimicrobiia bacterium]
MSRYLQTVEWSYPHVLAVLGGGLAGAVVAGIGVVLLYGAELTVVGFVLAFAGQATGSLLVLAYLSRKTGTGSFAADFGFELHLRDWWGLPAGAVLQFAAALVTAPLVQLFFPEGAPQQEVASIAEGSETIIEVLLILFAVGILAPVVEELTFRGMLLSRLVRSMSRWWAIAAQAGVFAGIHLLDPNATVVLPGLFLIGFVLGYAAIRKGSLSLPIFLHAGVNLTAGLLLVFGDDLVNWLDGLQPAESLVRMIL